MYQLAKRELVLGATQEVTFNGFTYRIYTTTNKIAWSTAETYCSNLGGNLVTIYSKQIDSLLYHLTTEITSCWIGLNDINNEAGKNANAFVWVDGSTSTYRQFATITKGDTEPSGTFGVIQRDCVDFRFGNDGSSDGWDDRECNANVYCYFCQKPGDSRGCDLIYEGSCYRAFEVSDGINWLYAQSSCVVWGGGLTSITTERENNLLYTAISDTVSNSWIGMYERDGDGMYQWVDGSVVSYTKWTGSAPTDGNTNDCVQMNTNRAGSWKATDCEGITNSFICKKPSTNDNTAEYGSTLSISTTALGVVQNESTIILRDESHTVIFCSVLNKTDRVRWYYRTYYSNEVIDKTSSSIFAVTNGMSSLRVNSNQPGYYSCVINTNISYTIHLADGASIVKILNFNSPTQQVNYTAGDLNSMLYYSHVNILDSSLRWTTDKVTDGTDKQYSNEYRNPVLLSRVFSDVGAGVHTFSCFYRMSPVTLVGSLQLVIRDTAVLSINYEGYDNTFSDVNNPMFPSPQQTTIPNGTHNVILTCHLTRCLWMIQDTNGRTIVESCYYIIPIFGSENQGNYSLIRENNLRENYSTAQVYISLQQSHFEVTAINPLIPIVCVILLAAVIVIVSIVVVAIVRKLIMKKVADLLIVPSITSPAQHTQPQLEMESSISITHESVNNQDNLSETEHMTIGGQYRIPAMEFPAAYKHYIVPRMRDELLDEFTALSSESMKHTSTSNAAEKNKNISKNTLVYTFPFDKNRVVLHSQHFECNFINASWLESNQFIASIHPTGNTLQDFLQMIYQTEASMVIMLSTRMGIISGLSNCECYWPKTNQPFKYCHFENSLISYTETTSFVKQEILLKHNLEGNSHSFIHCISPLWNEDSTVIELNLVVSLLLRVIKQKQDYPLNPIIIHCEDGISKTGIFLTLFKIIKELDLRNSINIFSAVCNLRRQRMIMVPTMACYTTCYSLMNEYCSIHL